MHNIMRLEFHCSISVKGGVQDRNISFSVFPCLVFYFLGKWCDLVFPSNLIGKVGERFYISENSFAAYANDTTFLAI